MFRSSTARWVLGFVIFIALLGVLRFKPWHRSGSSGDGSASNDRREVLRVAFLPVTCHLTCPVTAFASKNSPSTRFESQRFTDFPTMAESIKAGRIQAAFMIAPLAMKLREEGVPVKILYLGHRDGSEVMVAKNSEAQGLRDLRGKTFAIPSRYSNQNLVIHKLMEDQGVVRTKSNLSRCLRQTCPERWPQKRLMRIS